MVVRARLLAASSTASARAGDELRPEPVVRHVHLAEQPVRPAYEQDPAAGSRTSRPCRRRCRPRPPEASRRLRRSATGVITRSLDDTLITPYDHMVNLIVGRELPGNFAVEGGYVGRFGRDLLIRRDLAMPLNLTDPRSGIDYFTAAKQIIRAVQAAGIAPGSAGVGVLGIAPSRTGRTSSRVPPARRTRRRRRSRAGSTTTAPTTHVALADGPVVHPGVQRLRRRSPTSPAVRLAGGHQLDRPVELPLADRDAAQAVEPRAAVRPELHAVGVEGPRVGGRARQRFGTSATAATRASCSTPSSPTCTTPRRTSTSGTSSTSTGSTTCRSAGTQVRVGAGGVLNQVIGDWSIAGLTRWTSGLPFNVQNCRSCWPTNWNLQGNASLVTPGRAPGDRTDEERGDYGPARSRTRRRR